MKKITMIVMLILISTSVFAYTRSDYLTKKETHATLDKAYTWYHVCNPTDLPYGITEGNDFKVMFNNVKNSVESYKFTILKDESYIVEVHHQGEDCYFYDVELENGTSKLENCSVPAYTSYENKTRKVWDEWNPLGAVFESGDCRDIKVEGEYPFDLSGVAIDNILSFAGYDFDEYDWWNTTYFNDSFDNLDYIDKDITNATIAGGMVNIPLGGGNYYGGEVGITHLWHLDNDIDSVGSLTLQNVSGPSIQFNSTTKKYGSASVAREIIAFKTSSTPFNTSAGTIEFWYYALWETQPTSGNILSSVGGSNQGMFQLDFRPDNEIRWELYNGTAYINAHAYAILVPNEWYHFALTWNATSNYTDYGMALYINGVLNATNDTVMTVYPDEIIDKWGDFPTHLIDEMNVWDYEKKSFDLNQTYNNITQATVQSKILNTSINISFATLNAVDSTTSGTNIEYFLSLDNGTTWEQVTSGIQHSFNTSSKHLMWMANLTTNNTDTPYIYEISITVANETATEEEAMIEIESAIDAIIPFAIIYTDKQVYTRDASGNQKLGTIDKVAAYNSQRWAFNYLTDTDTATNLTGISNIFYVWEEQNMTVPEIRESVINLINSTLIN